MIQAGTSYSKNRTAQKAAHTACSEALRKAGIQRSLITLFFVTTEYRRHYPVILEEIRQVTGAKHIIGSSASGVLTEEAEIERQPGLAVMVIAADDIECVSFLVHNLQESNLRAGEKTASRLKESGIQPSNLFLFPDSFSFQSHPFFEGFEHGCEYLPITGSLAAENSGEDKTYQMHGDQAVYDALAGLALGGNIRTEMGITRSCQPFGSPLRITKADGNSIYEIDGRPAYDILLESISHVDLGNPDQIFQRIFLGYPVRSFQTNFSESHYLIRNIMGINAKKGVLTCVSPIEEGEFITFTLRDPAFARQDMRETLEAMRFRLAPHHPAFGFYFNSCARGKMLYQEPDTDVTLIRNCFPQVPILGCFGYGEIAPVDYVHHLHHYSGVLTLISQDH